MVLRRQQGFSYVLAMFAVAVASVLATRAMSNAMLDERRSREAELLYVGGLYRTAIMDFYENSPGGSKEYPQQLDDLLDDPRVSTQRRRSLRKLYRDPMTGGSTWGEVRTADGKHVMGVFSLSGKAPLKTGGFSTELAGFALAKSYREWTFQYLPN